MAPASRSRSTDRTVRVATGVVLLGCALVLGCGSAETPSQPVTSTPAAAPTPSVTAEPWSFPAAPSAAAGLATVTEQELRDTVFYLASEALAGRGSGEGGDLLAADRIADRFRQYGLRPGGGDTYRQPFSVPRGSGQTANVVGYLPGTDSARAREVILIGAHHDHLGGDGQQYFPGADDNASGTAAVIEAAEALGRLRAGLPRTVVFATFSGEELGLLGSRHYVANPTFPIAQTVYMLDLDMLGHLEQGRLHVYGGADSRAFGALLREVAARYAGMAPLLEGQTGGSDHVPFRTAGVPAILLHTGLTATYHTVNDTADSLAYPELTTLTRIAVELVWRIAHGTRAAGAAPLAPLPWTGPGLDHDARPFLAH